MGVFCTKLTVFFSSRLSRSHYLPGFGKATESTEFTEIIKPRIGTNFSHEDTKARRKNGPQRRYRDQRISDWQSKLRIEIIRNFKKLVFFEFFLGGMLVFWGENGA